MASLERLSLVNQLRSLMNKLLKKVFSSNCTKSNQKILSFEKFKIMIWKRNIRSSYKCLRTLRVSDRRKAISIQVSLLSRYVRFIPRLKSILHHLYGLDQSSCLSIHIWFQSYSLLFSFSITKNTYTLQSFYL